MNEFEKLLAGGLDVLTKATAVNNIVNNNEGAGNEQIRLDTMPSVSVPTDDAQFVATPAPAPALGGINPLYIVGGIALIAFVALRR